MKKNSFEWWCNLGAQGWLTKSWLQYYERLELGEEWIMCDYFAKNLIYDDKQFCHHYLMRHVLLLQVVHFVNACDGYFMQQQDVCGTMGLFAL